MSTTEVLFDDQWTHLTITYNGAGGILKTYANGEMVIEETNLLASIDSLPLQFRFSNLIAGSSVSSFKGLMDDLRLYRTDLTNDAVGKIYNSGGGDYHTLKILGFGKTRITAFQNGNETYEKANSCLLYTSPSPRDQRGSRMPSSA